MESEQNAVLPHQLKTIEIDVENRTFKMNGKEFGNDCTHFKIVCDALGGFRIEMEVYERMECAKYTIGGDEM